MPGTRAAATTLALALAALPAARARAEGSGPAGAASPAPPPAAVPAPPPSAAVRVPPSTDGAVEAGETPLPAPPAAPRAAVVAEAPWWTRLRLYANLGATSAYGSTYGALGLGVGYAVGFGLVPSLQLGVGFGGSPTVVSLQPGLDWFAPVPGPLRPYVGAYWSQWFVGSGYDDQAAYGFRFGLGFARLGPSMFTLGLAWERAYAGCTSGCSFWIPQVGAAFAL